MKFCLYSAPNDTLDFLGWNSVECIVVALAVVSLDTTPGTSAGVNQRVN